MLLTNGNAHANRERKGGVLIMDMRKKTHKIYLTPCL